MIKYKHIITYYAANKVVKEIVLTETIYNRANYYKNLIKNNVSHHPILELGKFTFITRCVRFYDYSINKIIKVK
jgi:hypothetical protein